jgi:UDP-2,3-diacylglucosamine pyrophosphatase LpxH
VPAIRQIDGIAYYNCGDWVEHCSALVEHVDGRMELVGPATPIMADIDADMQAA